MIEKVSAPVLSGIGSFDGPAQITPQSLMAVLDEYGRKLNEIIDVVNAIHAPPELVDHTQQEPVSGRALGDPEE